MQLHQVSISTPSADSRLERLPYRDHLLAIERDERCLRIVAIQDASTLSVHPAAAGIELHIEASRYTLALPADHTLYIGTGNGNDRVTLATQDSQVVLQTAAGDDQIRLQRAPAASGGGYVVVDAGQGNDVIVADGLQEVEIDAGAGNDFIASNAAQAMLYAGPGNDEIRVDDGRANLEAQAGDNRIATGPLDTRIYGKRNAITATGGFDAPLLFEAQQPEWPAAYARTFDIQGDREYVERVARQLNMLRASPAASPLLEELVAKGVRLEIVDWAQLDNARAEHGPGDPKVRNGQRGERILNCRVRYNPLAHRPGTPSLVMLYHELCHVWNFATGSVLGDGERQAVGLPSGEAAFDFDDDPSTPGLDSNPAPFNENALRHELGLAPRNGYP